MNTLFLYIDPGTGSMLFSLFIGLATTAVFAGRALILKLKFLFSGGKLKEDNSIVPYAVYSDHKRYWNIFKPVCDEFEKRKTGLLYLTQSKDDPVFGCDYKFVKPEFIGEGNKGFARLNMLKANILLSTTPGLDVLQWKRSRNVKWYVHIPHTVDELAGYRMFALDFYDAVLATGTNQKDTIRSLEKARNESPKEITVCGCVHFDSMKERVLKSAVDKKTETTVLVAPSWGKSSLLNLYGTDLLDSLSSSGFNIIIRPHPQSYTAEPKLLQNLKAKYADNTRIVWNNDNDNFECLQNADLMITDFSGIIFDYSMIFDKPLLYTRPQAFDDAPYEQSWLNEERWTFKVLPELGIELKETDFANIKDVILSAIKSTTLERKRNAIRKQCWDNPGNAVTKVFEYLANKQTQIMEETIC